MEWRRANDVAWIEARLPKARAVFSSRIGGVSEGPFESLNLGVLIGDDLESALENRRRLAAALGLGPERVAVGHQLHGADLATHLEARRAVPFLHPGTEIIEVDGHVTSVPNLAPLVFVADCLPIALSGRSRVAVLHCGWRGLAAGIVARGVAAVGATDAAIGPGIGPCCYEVGEEVLGAFDGLGPGIAVGRNLDLVAVADRLLRAAGVERIEAAGLCTSCEADRFFSHRRDAGRTGRQAGLVWLDSAGS